MISSYVNETCRLYVTDSKEVLYLFLLGDEN